MTSESCDKDEEAAIQHGVLFKTKFERIAASSFHPQKIDCHFESRKAGREIFPVFHCVYNLIINEI